MISYGFLSQEKVSLLSSSSSKKGHHVQRRSTTQLNHHHNVVESLLFYQVRGGGNGNGNGNDGGSNSNHNNHHHHHEEVVEKEKENNIYNTTTTLPSDTTTTTTTSTTSTTSTTNPKSSESILESYVEHVSQKDALSHSFYNHNNNNYDPDIEDDDDGSILQLKKKERDLNDPDDSDDDNDNDDDDNSDHDNNDENDNENDDENEKFHPSDTNNDNDHHHINVDIVPLHDNNEDDVENEHELKVDILHHSQPSPPQTTTTTTSQSSSQSSSSSLNPFDQALIDAFLPLFYPPPSTNLSSFMKKCIIPNSTNIDISSRRRLDRRTLYQSLLLEWNSGISGIHTNRKNSSNGQKGNGNYHHKSSSSSSSSSSLSKRNFVNEQLSHQLKSSISLASQPLWRRHINNSFSTTTTNNNNNNNINTSRTTSSNTNDNEKEKENNHNESTTTSTSSNDHNHNNMNNLPNRSFYSTGIRLYTTNEEDDDDDIVDGEDEFDMDSDENQSSSSLSSNSIMNHYSNSNHWMNHNNDNDESSPSSSSSTTTTSSNVLSSLSYKSKSTLSIQETIALALAHSYNCGLVLLDDVGLQSVQEALVENKELKLDYNSKDVSYGSLVNSLIRLANEGKLPRVMGSGSWKGGRISNRMERDIALGLDDPNDELAIESMKLMKSDEEMWMSTIHDDDDNNHNANGSESYENPLPLVLFLRTDASPNLLKSKSTVDRLARECVNEDSIHLLMLGRGIDATTVQLPTSRSSGGGGSSNSNAIAKNSRKPAMQPPPSIMGLPPNMNHPFFPPPGSQHQQHNPFAGMSSMPPPGVPGNFMAPNNDNGNPFGFTQQNINASGVNDPEGSRRFNIFLARTVDKDGTPGIMGAIAPPQVGNLFPQMLAMQARENYIRSQEEGASEEEIQKHEANMQRWSEIMEQQQKIDNAKRDSGKGKEMLPPQFFNASISGGPEGMPSFMNMDGNNQFNGMVAPPPELIQRAIEEAVTDVMKQLTEMSHNSGKSDDNNPLPPHLAKAFAQILSNDNLRRGIAENLARAAPALVDPRCQGVMLSVYVPPPPEHPNRGMMPGQQRSQQQHQGKKASRRGKSNSLGAPGMGGWLNKILSTSPSPSSVNNDEESNQAHADSGDEENSDNEGESTNLQVADDDERDEATFINEEISKAAEKKLKKRDRQARAAAVAAATAMINKHQEEKRRRKSSSSSQTLSVEQKIEKHLTRLQALCKPTPLKSPADPVRSRSWDAWTMREHGAIIFRKNRRALNSILSQRNLRIDSRAGTKGMGSVLRQMLSVKDISHDMDELITCAVEFEAARSQRMQVRF
jgi:hypothetical protein